MGLEGYSLHWLSQTDGNGNSSHFEYDKLVRLLKTILPDNSIRTLAYEDIGNQLTATDANGNSLIYDYDGLGRLQNVKDATNTTLVKRAYDSNGVLISEWDGNKNTQQLSYDPLYRITGVSHYDKNGNMLAQTRVAYNEAYYDRFGKPFLNVTVRKKGEGQDHIGTYYFDSFGLLSKQGRIHQGQEEMSYAWYDYLGNCVKAQDYAGNRSVFAYDGRGRLLEATDALGQTVNFTYDLLGNQIAKSDALGQTAYFDYDSLGHNVATKVPYQEGQYSISKGYYDPAGNLVKTVDPEGYVTNNHYNSRNLLEAVEQIIGVKQSNITRYEYDREGNLIKLEKGLNDWNDPDYSTYTYQYDSLNRLIKTMDAEHQASTYDYDRNGNLIQSTDRNGVITGYSYDGLNRLVKKQNSRDGKQTLMSSSFDQLGNLREVNDATGTTQYEYDDLGRLIHINYGNGMRQQYAYDSADRINEMIVMQGSLNQIDLKYQYDRVGRLTAVNDNGKWFTYQYDEIGRLINQQNGVNGINSEYSYYPSGNVRSLRHFNSGEIVASYEYQYDMRGNQIQKDEGANTSRYYYDALSRIKVAQLPNDITQNYEYDDLNNIKEIAEIKGTQIAQTNFTYDHNSRLLLSETVNGDDLRQLRFEYDAEGNQTYKEEVEKQSGNLIASEAYNFWYNGFNQLERVKDPNGSFIEYTYNAQGLRTKKDFLDHAINYIYDRGNIILESDQDYLVTAKNIRGLQLIYRETGDETLYYLHNAHGDVTKLLNDKGWVIKDYDYDPFGREEAAPIKAFGGDISTEIWRNETQQIDNPFRYCGEYLDDETGNYYLRARYYDPEARRFTSEDSVEGDICNPLSLNSLIYCYNNPINMCDLNGNMPVLTLRTISQWYNNGHLNPRETTALGIVFNGLNVYNAFHEIAQLNIAKTIYGSGYGTPILEYTVKSKTETNFFGVPKKYEADIVLGAQMWEVKLAGSFTQNSFNEQAQIYMNNGDLSLGSPMQPIVNIPIYRDIFMRIDFPQPGLAEYKFYNDSGSVSTQELVSDIKDSQIDASIAVIAIIGVTLLEDIITDGIGVLDNPLSAAAAGAAAAAILGL